jgi:Tol biopolymer transport system component
MKGIWGGLACAVIVAAMVAVPQAWGRVPGGIVRVSVSSSGAQADDWSGNGSVSADARLAAFESQASNLLGEGGRPQVFLHNLKRGGTRQVSVSPSGRTANGVSLGPVISADGHYVAYYSDATNLVRHDRNRDLDVFVRNLRTGKTRLVSRSTAGSQGNRDSAYMSLSANGRLVAFWSSATNLVSHDTNGKYDVFARNLRAGITQRVSVSSSGGQAHSQSTLGSAPSVSADGHRVLFSSSAPLVPGDTNRRRDVFVRNLRTKTTRRVNVSSAGAQGNGWSDGGSISPNGRFVTFTSAASNLVPHDTNGIPDAFIHDLRTRRTQRLSVSSSGAQSDFQSYSVFVASDGKRTAFDSGGSNLVPRDINHAGDVFVHNTRTGRTHLISRSIAGEQGNGSTYISGLTPDGRFAVFDSEACNLVPHDTNNEQDVFVRGPLRWPHAHRKVEPPGCDPSDPP